MESYVLQQLTQRGRTDSSGRNFETTVGSCWDIAALAAHTTNFSLPGRLLGVAGLT